LLVPPCSLAPLPHAAGRLAGPAGGGLPLGLGTALVYPTLIAAMSDAVTPVARPTVVGVYRFWRDSGYVFGGLIAGVVADALGYGGAIGLVAGLTAASGLWVWRDMPSQEAVTASRSGTPPSTTWMTSS
jgi:hypothetical protein